jgi:mRNA-degrading endonuclease RelE of RelBE toxin-antitoxin system
VDYLGRQARALVVTAVVRLLGDQPSRGAGARKRLEPHPFTFDWQARVGSFRAYHDVDGDERVMTILQVRYKPRETQ